MATAELASALGQRLSTQWAFVLTTLLALAGAWFLQGLFKPDPLSKFPMIGEEIGDEAKRRAYYKQGARALYNQGWAKCKNGLGVFRVTTHRAANTVVVHPKYLPELKSLSPDVLSFTKAIDENMHPAITGIRSDRDIIPYVLTKMLTPHLPNLDPLVAEEVDLAFRRYFPPCEDFTAININKPIERIVTQAAGRVFVGTELCRSDNYIDMATSFTLTAVAAAEAVSNTKVSERVARAPHLQELKNLEALRKHGATFFQPVINARLKARKDDPNFQKPYDILQWVLDTGESRFGEQTNHDLLEIQLGLVQASIHTTSMLVSNAIYCLAVMPDLVSELREEARATLKEYGTYTSNALESMKKMDSFLREVMRFYPLSLVTFERKVLKPFVLSNGLEIPAGCVVEAPSIAAMQDPDLIANGLVFDPLRFYRSRESSASADKAGLNASNQLVAVSTTSLHFGFGRHACPGRFFAAAEVKMVIGHLLLNYELKNADGSKERHPNLSSNKVNFPDFSKQISFRRLAE